MDTAVHLLQRGPDPRPLLVSRQTFQKRSPALREIVVFRAGEIPVDPTKDASLPEFAHVLGPLLQPAEKGLALLPDTVGGWRRRRAPH